jgi:transposase
MSTVTRKKRYSSDFKTHAVELVRLGKSVPDVAEELGIGTGILYRWTQSQRQTVQLVGTDLRAGGVEGEANELHRLRREIANLRLENDILKKAAVILGTTPPSKPAK